MRRSSKSKDLSRFEGYGTSVRHHNEKIQRTLTDEIAITITFLSTYTIVLAF